MKNKGLTVFFLVCIIMALVVLNVIVGLECFRLHKENLKLNQKNIDDAKYNFDKICEYEEEIDNLKEELSKYDSNYKNIIDIRFEANLEKIINDENSIKLFVNGEDSEFISKGDFYLLITDETEIIKNNDIVDSSYLEEGQKLRVTFSSEILDTYPDTLDNVTKVEVLD